MEDEVTWLWVVTRWKKAGEQTGARGALLPLKTAPQGQNESPASLPFTSFYSSAKQVLVSALKGAALPNTKSSLLAPEHCEQRTATVWIPQPPWYTYIFIADLYNVSVHCPVWPCVCVCVCVSDFIAINTLTASTYAEGTAIAQWLRRCATNRKVAGSIPAGVSGFSLT